MIEASQSPIRIVLVDDSELMRRGIKTVFADAAGRPATVVGEAATVAGAINLGLQLKPDLMILEARLPDGTGFDACRKILQALPSTRIVILTSQTNDNLVYDAVAAGAQGILLKDIAPASLRQAVQDVAAGRSILGPDATARVLRLLRAGASTEKATDLSLLSRQETRVLALVAAGMTNKQVGEKLGLSENTVKNYLMNVFEKLKVKRRAQAATIYVQQSETARR